MGMVEVVRDKKSKHVLVGVVIFMFIALLAVTIAVIVISAMRNQQPANTETNQSNETQQQSNDSDNGQSDNDDDETEVDSGEIAGSIDYQGIVNDTLQIRTTIQQQLKDGTCVLTLNGPKDQTYKATSRIIANSSSTSTCDGFDIPVDTIEEDEELRAGAWTITIDLSSTGKIGQLTSEITL